MKLLIIGATGNTGITVLEMAVREGHTVTAFVRDEEKLKSMLVSRNLPLPDIVAGDVFDEARIQQACHDQDAVINVAGHVSDGKRFVQLVHSVTNAVEAGMGPEGRFWLFGGAAALDVPGTDYLTVTLPKVPQLFRSHEQNYRHVKASVLNWSMLCPGPMIKSVNGKPHEGIRISTDTWPVPRPEITRHLPGIATSLAFKRAMPQLTVCYEDAARVVLDNLAATSPLARKRVGLALPPGVRQAKNGLPLGR